MKIITKYLKDLPCFQYNNEYLFLVNPNQEYYEVYEDSDKKQEYPMIYLEEDIPDLKNEVFVVLKNSDFTEGREPMKFHKIFSSYVKAVKYILSQTGIYGSKQSMTIRGGVSINNNSYLYTSFNGYDIKISEIE